jgi:DNA-binding NarL/FixJ family response regulator
MRPERLLDGDRMRTALRILFIDDNKEESDYFIHRIQTCSPEFTILHSDTGQAGLAMCKEASIDCIVLELGLPDISGFEVLLKLVPRVWRPDNAVIVLTRLANKFLLEAALTNGACAAFYKPMTSGDMLDKAILKAMSTVARERKKVIA